MPCTNCMAKYTLMRKEHGCSNCGFSFCAKCLSKRIPVPKISQKPLPVCDNCFITLNEKTGKVPIVPQKSREEDPTDTSALWASDDAPPPSFRDKYPIVPKILKKNSTSKPEKKPSSSNDELTARLASLTGKTVNDVRNPSVFVVDPPSTKGPSTSKSLLRRFRSKDETAEDLIQKTVDSPEVRSGVDAGKALHENEMLSLEERLAKLKGVDVEQIRKPRTLVVNQHDSDSDQELTDDAKNLILQAEKKLRKDEPQLFAFYDNLALETDEYSPPPRRR